MNQTVVTRNGPPPNTTQLGLARRFVAQYGEDLRYSYLRRCWLYWDGQRWVYDDGGRVELLMKQAIDLVLIEVVETTNEERRKALLKFALQMERKSEQKGALDLARSEPGIPVALGDLDSDPWLLNVRNGTIDLRTGELREHRRNDLMTYVCDVEYDAQATAPRWLKFLEEIIRDPEVRAFLQKAIGYSLTGDTREHVFFICHGSGANGKSVFFETILRMLGGLAIKCPSETIAKYRSTGIPNDVARLAGKRLAAAVELEDGFHLAESRVKEIVGGDTITARFMRGEWFDFRPICKLWIASNYRPKIKGADYGMWRRVRLIPFEVTIEKPDRSLSEKLAGELPGILRWAVEGCRLWQADGLEPPAKVRVATSSYRTTEDLIGRFIDEECVRGQSEMVSKSDFYQAFMMWCLEAGEDLPAKRKLGARLIDLGIGENRTGTARSWKGIGLRSDR